ncbi:thiamin pyrophosphokinase 1 [Melitaea cinxia]|uniref:thiamin pyrophosphokinase 1 n=1 Tax=Melitaea cinxia TaxID=113334 RepID=UPI001E27345A|nr:thiamin pyrophosphokinase 1 [Melitaea cinxia]
MEVKNVLMKVSKLLNVFYVQQNRTSSVVKCWKWNIGEFIKNQANQVNLKYAVLILNRTIPQRNDFIKDLWNNATLTIAVDGGMVHWDNFVNKLTENDRKNMKLPDLITGDFDSITNDVLEKYKKKGCKTIHTPDQNHTDFTKALKELNNYCEQEKIQVDHVIAVAQSSGRLDQILGNIQTLYLVREERLLNPNTKMYLMSGDCIAWLLSPGAHIIDIPEECRCNEECWCALMPVGEACDSVTTSGLKWNLDKQQLKFGRLVSTSNTFDGSEQVKVKCSNTLLWAMEVPSLTNT